ncbi:MAG: putative NUDIX family phosphoesterase [Psychroserpens sp.]|jgi:predicted NUDIX family phosphoesterase
MLIDENLALIEAIKLCLSESNFPLTAEEICETLEAKHSYKIFGDTPKNSIRSRLSTNINNLGAVSEFARFSKGTYGLRLWLELHPEKYLEYSSKKSQEIRMNEYLPVFPKSQIIEIVPYTGFTKVPVPTNWFQKNCSRKIRTEAEKDLNLVQLVSVFVIHFGDQVLTHTRSKWAPEKRLHGEKSVHFGGHINFEEILSFFDPFDPISPTPNVIRELEEEIEFKDAYKIKYEGLIYDDSREVSSQHLGICYSVNITSEKYKIGEKGYHINANLDDINRIKTHKNEFENWSRLLIENLDIFS